MPNLFTPLAPATLLPTEQFDTLLESASVKIERILSHAQVSPPGHWYDQAQDEWVLLIRGAATLEYDTIDQRLQDLHPGDHLLIPAHTRHRVAHTTADTLWLAVHLKTVIGQESSVISHQSSVGCQVISKTVDR